MIPTLLCLLALADDPLPITPNQLHDALQVPPRGPSAEALAGRIRAAFPKDADLKAGLHAPLIEGSLVAFVLEAPADSNPRVAGMVNHGQGLDLVPIGSTGLWARVESIPTDTKFAYCYDVGGKKVGGRAVEMPDWRYPPESKEQPGRTYGQIIPLRFRSAVFRNNRTGAIYVPATYDPAGPPAALMVFQDGDAYLKEHVGTVIDNLIAEEAMPVTILLLLNPGINDDGGSNRSVEYDTLSDQYATFLEREAIPRVATDYKIHTDPARRAIGGASSGGICAFTVAWQRPDLFGRVCSQIGSFTNIRGGNAYPDLIRSAPKKPIKVFLSDGTNDLINQYGDWWQANEAMFAALTEKGYDVAFLRDRGFHAFWTCGRQLPEALRRTWADPKPGSKQ
ncbi:MAG TPA: alpha/beta hydrolase-fold protein [Isosphaeraceae bacterium]|nr:alpha/beta hydrolase-fold protein [Isosphaeraceae bacterium]